MSSKYRRKKLKPQEFESIGEGLIPGTSLNESFVSIYESMLHSKAWKSLSNRQKLLYIYAKAQFFGKHKPVTDFPDIEQVNNNCFYFSRHQAVDVYQLYTPSMERYLYKDFRVLQEKGFIDIVSSGKANHMRSIYKFSSRWKTWTDVESKLKK